MSRIANLSRTVGSVVTTALTRHPRTVVTAGLAVVLFLSSDTAGAAEIGAGSTSVGDVSGGP
ncbi:hypothetical protein SAMN05443636_2452 [Halobaculum gomorrense]|uniref:Uncharacterized protein n=1 Tax=Halobaculum gomorrense TaxID=43928 RepID=A0A1M5SG05_9EURY|nr:hypothetical protein SAMN05443636_2452 [Halobaculum gomorrense]